MSVWVSLKIFSDLCVLFAVLGAFPTVIVYHSSLMLPAVICAAGVGIAAAFRKLGRVRVQWLSAAFPLIALYYSCHTEEFWIILPAAVYTIFVIFWDRLNLEYYSYRQSFRNSLLIVGGLYVILSMFSFLEGISTSEVRIIYEEATLRYGLIHFITGIVLQRQLRLGIENRSKENHLQIATVLIGTGSVVLAFIAAEEHLRKGAAAIFHSVLSAVMSVVIFAYEKFFDLINQIELKAMYETVNEARANRDMPTAAPVLQQIIQQNTQAAEEEQSLWWMVLIAALLLIIILLLLRAFRKPSHISYAEESVRRLDNLQSRKELRRTNRGKVRHYYREYLRYEKKQGLSLKKYYTSNDILQKSVSESDKEAESALRQLYLSARYDNKAEVTREQAEQAKDALRRIRASVKGP